MSATTFAVHQNEQRLIDKGRKQGIELGIEQGAFEMALRIKRTLGLDQAVLISDFSREELENEKLNR